MNPLCDLFFLISWTLILKLGVLFCKFKFQFLYFCLDLINYCPFSKVRNWPILVRYMCGVHLIMKWIIMLNCVDLND